MSKLSKAAINRAMKDHAGGTVKLSDGAGLYAEITQASAARGEASWRLKYRFGGVEKRLTIGRYPATTPEEARKQAQAARELLASGVDPSAQKKAHRAAQEASEVLTLQRAVDNWLDHMAAEGWVKRTVDGTRQLLNDHILVHVGDMPAKDVTRGIIARLIDNLRDRPPTAYRAWSSLSRTLALVEHMDDGYSNPLAGRKPHFSAGRPEHRAAFTPKQLGSLQAAEDALRGFLQAVDSYQGSAAVRAGLRLMAAIPARPGELVAMRWGDLELGEDCTGWWRFKQGKTGEPQALFLPRQVVAIITSLPRDGEYVLQAPRNKAAHIWVSSLRSAIYGLGHELSTHGGRATFRSLGRERLRLSVEVLEACLGHRSGIKHGGAYDQAGLADEKREALTAWADYLDSLRG